MGGKFEDIMRRGITRQNNNLLPDLLTTKEVAQFLRISESRVYTLCSQHEFPHIKITNRRTRYSARAIITWLDERTVGEGMGIN